MGEAFVVAHNFVVHNRESVEKIADAVMEKQELYGDELMRLLDSVRLEKPEIDLTEEDAWPRL
jgi:hypothetical protein